MIPEKSFYNVQKKLIEKIEKEDKYSRLHFVVTSLTDITMENGLWMLNKYGGELLEDIFIAMELEDFYAKNIAKIGEAYAIEFKIDIDKAFN